MIHIHHSNRTRHSHLTNKLIPETAKLNHIRSSHSTQLTILGIRKTLIPDSHSISINSTDNLGPLEAWMKTQTITILKKVLNVGLGEAVWTGTKPKEEC